MCEFVRQRERGNVSEYNSVYASKLAGKDFACLCLKALVRVYIINNSSSFLQYLVHSKADLHNNNLLVQLIRTTFLVAYLRPLTCAFLPETKTDMAGKIKRPRLKKRRTNNTKVAFQGLFWIIFAVKDVSSFGEYLVTISHGAGAEAVCSSQTRAE